MELPENIGYIILGALVVLVIGVVLVLIIGAVIGLLVFFSSSTVDYTSYGLKKNKISHKVTLSKVYEPGRHLIGLTSTFLAVPSLPQFVEFVGGRSIAVRTVEGLSINVEVTFQYRIAKEQVIPLFTKYTTRYESTIEAQALKVLRDVGQLYNAVDFIENRANITTTMYEALDFALRVNPVNLEYFQLARITFPPDYEDRLLTRSVRNQNILVAALTQQLNTYLSQTQVLLADISKQQRTIQLELDGQKLFLQSSAQGNSTALRLEAETDAYKAIKTSLQFDNTKLLRFLYYDALKQTEAGKMAVNLNTPLLLTDEQLVAVPEVPATPSNTSQQTPSNTTTQN